MTASVEAESNRARVCVVGSGTRFVSGISYFTYYLTTAIAGRYQTSAILMRNLVPRRLYPGRDRVGASITELQVSDICPTYDGVDWHLIPSLPRAARFLRGQVPDIVIFQWWTGAVLPSYLYLQWTARRLGAKVVVEFHEDQDTGETALPLVERLVRPGLRRFIRRSDHFVVHSQWDKSRLCEKLGLPERSVSVVPHGPYFIEGGSPVESDGSTKIGSDVTILFFGTIRPYKGLEDLIEAFELLPREGTARWRLLVVGETWEGWTLPAEKITSSRFGADIEFVNRYVGDDEVAGFFSRVDVVALPYLRSSASGPLHLSMQRGLPVVVTDVGGLTEAVNGYSGAVLVPPRDPAALASAIVTAAELRGKRHVDFHTWEHTLECVTEIVESLMGTGNSINDLPS